MNAAELDRVAYATHTTKKKKGANKGYKLIHAVVWSGAISRKAYIEKLNEIDPKECGVFLCRAEYYDFTDCRWWDTPDYRDEAIREYRDRIKAIRLKYGLSKSEVASFMRVE